MKSSKDPGFTRSTKTSVRVEEVILFNVTLGDLQVRFWFGVVAGLVTNLLLRTSLFNRFIARRYLFNDVSYRATCVQLPLRQRRGHCTAGGALPFFDQVRTKNYLR